MSRLRSTLALALTLAGAATARAQYDNNPRGGDGDAPADCVGAPAKVNLEAGLIFNPPRLVVARGTPVCWSWANMAHSVRADDGSFNSGAPSPSGTFQKTFDVPGTYGYHCQLHGSPEGGMRGEIVVQADEPPPAVGPGTVQVAAAALAAGEAAGPAQVIVERVGGSEGKATVVFNTIPGSAKSPADFQPARNKSLTWNPGELGPKTVSIVLKNDKAKESAETFSVVLSKPTGAALGATSTTVTINDDDSPSCPASSSIVSASLRAAGESATQIRIAWPAEAASGALVHLERRTPSGTFQEVAALSGVAQFVDTGLQPGTTYLYRLADRDDEGGWVHSDTVAAATDGPLSECDPSAAAACLLDGRFEASIEGLSAEGHPRAGFRRHQLAESAGVEVFSREAVGPAVFVGVIAGCAVNRHYGVTIAVLDETEVTVRVRDTVTGKTWARFVPSGGPSALRDPDAFATCP